MATVEEAREVLPVVKLSDLEDGQEAECFAALVNRILGKTYKGDPFVKCVFRDRRIKVDAMLWSNHRFHQQAQGWTEGLAYRLRARGTINPKYGLQIDIFDIRPAVDTDAADGYDFADLVEGSRFDAGLLYAKILEFVNKSVCDPHLKFLVLDILQTHEDLFKRIQAAEKMHHAFTGGLIEHVWSMTRISVFLADHYAKYYDHLNPPLNKGVIVAAAILHDIGKLRELEYHPVEAKYTKEGSLVGHVLMGRDMVRDAALRIDGFPAETLLLLEHAILSHHGKKEFGAPILPQTMEALIVSHIDDLDAKVNAAAKGRLACETDGEFTDKIWCLDNRRFYKGIPVEPPGDED
jgi:3'-5' exoribonuclease